MCHLKSLCYLCELCVNSSFQFQSSISFIHPSSFSHPSVSFIHPVSVIHLFHSSIQPIKLWGQHFPVSFIHYFITAYITTHPKTTHTTQAMNMFIFNISFSSLSSNSFLCLSPSGLPTEASSSTTSAQFDGRTMTMPRSFNCWKYCFSNR